MQLSIGIAMSVMIGTTDKLNGATIVAYTFYKWQIK